MKLPSLLQTIQAEMLTGVSEAEIDKCYMSDLLSDVLAHAHPGVMWVTIQTHRNVVSVAAMKDMSAVLFTCGRRPDGGVIAEAEAEGITLLTTPLTTYETAGRLWQAGVRN